MNGEIISESELKKRIESIPQFIFDQKNEQINTAKLSLNIWLIINSGTASAIIVKGFFSTLSLIAFAAGLVFTSFGYIILYSYSRNAYKNVIDYIRDERNINTLLISQENLSKKLTRVCIGCMLCWLCSYITAFYFLIF